MATKKRKNNRHSRAGRRILIILIILLVLFCVMVYLAPPPEESTTQTNANVPAHLELPSSVQGEQLVTHTGYTLSYNEEYEQPSWVAYELTRDEVNGALDRADNFRPDPAVRTGSATLDDYKGSGYDRGHLCPAADQKWSAEAMDDSFYLSNMSPQAGPFNRGIWSSLEAVVRTNANDLGSIYVATGPVLTDGPYKTIGKNRVAVPKQYYKAILYYDGTTAKGIGFLLPNEGSSKTVKSYATSIDNVESVTGLDFFPALPDDIESTVESSYNVTDWDWKEFSAGDGPKTLVTKSNNEKANDTVKEMFLVFCNDLKKEVVSWLKSL